MNFLLRVFIVLAFFYGVSLVFLSPAYASYMCFNGIQDCYATPQGACYGTGSSWSDIPMSNCISQGNTPPPNTCNATGNWDFSYYICQIRQDPNDPTGCQYETVPNHFSCSAADACEGGSGGGTGYASNGHVIAGHCSPGSYVEGNPASACTSYGYYKQCCSAGLVDPTTACSAGTCPYGQITSAFVTTCGSPTPGAPSTSGDTAYCNGNSASIDFSFTSGSGATSNQVHYSVDSPSLNLSAGLPSSPYTINGFTPGHRIYFNIYSCNSSGCTADPNGYYYVDLPATCGGGGGATATPTPTPTTSGSFCSGTCGTSSFSGSCTTSGGQPGTWQWDGGAAQSKSNCDNVYAYCYNCIATSGPTTAPPASCSTTGQTCGTGCCSPLVCTGGVCQFPPPPPTVATCGKSGQACGIGCCPGLVCTASSTCLAPSPTPVPHVTVQGHMVDATGSDLSLDIGQSVTIKQSGSSPLAPQFQSLGYFWSNSLPPSTYTVTATVPNNYKVESSTCVNCTTHNSYASTNPVTVSLPSNGNYADIYFRYTLKTCTTTFSGNVVVDPDTNDCTSLATLGGTAYNGFGQVTAYNGTTPAAQQVNLSSGAYSSLSYSPICGSSSFITLSGVLYPVTGVCDNGVYHAQASYTYPYTNTNSPTENRNVTYLLTSQGPWFQVDTGDVRFPNINNKVPKGANASASGASLFASSVGNTLLGKGNFPLTSNWQVNQEYAYNSDFENGLGSMSYTFYMSRAAQLQMLPTKNNVTSPVDLSTLGSGIYQTDGDLSITASSGIDGTCATGGKHVLLLVGGTATVNGPFSVPAGHCNLFVLAAQTGITFAPAVGTSTFSSAVSNVDGYYTSEGNIVLNGTNNCASGTDKRLNVGGALIANSLHPFARLGQGKIIVNRNICAANATYPTYYVSPRPDFYLQMSDFYKIPYKTIKEVEP